MGWTRVTRVSLHPDRLPERADVGMAWGIKRSFVDYVRRLDDARWDFSGGAAMTTGRELYFPLAAEQPGWPSVAFAGAVTIAAHFGALRIALDRPVVSIEPGGVLAAEGADLVALHPSPPVLDGDVVMWRIDTALAPEAVPLFNGAYGDGEPFDVMTVRVPRDLVPANLDFVNH